MTESQNDQFSPLELLRFLRDTYSDEIPSRILNGSMPKDQIRYKCRKNWWHGLMGDLTLMQSRGLIPPCLEIDVEEFVSHYASKKFRKQPLITAEDIQKANGLITRIIGDK